MLAGFAGEAEKVEEVKDAPKDETPAEVKTEPAPKEPTLSDVMAALQALDGRQRKIEGKFGEVNGSVKALQEAAQAARAATAQGHDAPTQTQVAAAASAAAAGDFRKLDSIIGDFPDIGNPVRESMIELRDEILAQMPKFDAKSIDERISAVDKTAQERSQAAIDEAEERALLRFVHRDWKQVVKTPEFDTWFDAQPPEIQALAASRVADDSIKLLDAFKAHREAAAAEATRKQSQTRRLASAVPLQGKGAAGGPQVLDDEAAFLEGFKTG
ncbi:MAG: hypothetical protein ACM3SS_11515 [Rhodospirillaceae bacterium]